MNLTTEGWSYCQNQASDYRYMLESFEKGEVMRARSVENTAGGKGLHVANVLHALGANAVVGANQTTEYITLEYLDELQNEMLEAAEKLEFERAAYLRDRINALREKIGTKTTVFEFDQEQKKKGRGRGRGGASRSRIPKPER